MPAMNQLLSAQLSKFYNLLFQWLLPSNVDMALGAGLFPENRLPWLQWVLILALCMVGYQSTEISAVT